MRRRCPALLLAVVTVVALLPGVALAAPAPAGHVGADPQSSRIYPGVGPALPGADYLVTLTDFAEPNREVRLLLDSAGQLLYQGRGPLGEDLVDRIAALDQADGSPVWTTDHIEDSCKAVATDDGRIFAQAVTRSPLAGADNFSSDLVALDAATGDVLDQYTPADTEDPGQTRLGPCVDSLRLGADDTVIVLYRGSRQTGGSEVLRAFTTDGGLAEAWIVELPQRTGSQLAPRPVVSPDGQTVYVGHDVTGDNAAPIEMQISAFDVATGDVVAEVAVPGTAFERPDTFIHTGDALLVATGATGGADDPDRVISLDPDTLTTNWMVESVEDAADGFTLIDNIALAGDHVVVQRSADLYAYRLADGTAAWTHDVSSFSNNGSQMVTDAAGNLYFSSFGGAALESVTADGQRRFITDRTDEFLGEGVDGEAFTLGPVVDGRIYTIFREAEGDSRPILAAIGAGQERLEGAGDPISAAIQICQYLFADDRARTVVLSRDDLFADTLAGAPLAGDHSCILFTEGGPDRPLNPDTLAEIRRALPDGATVRIAGGTAAVSQQAEDTLVTDGFAVERLAGPGRLETAVEIARVVRAENPGAEAAAVLAFSNNWPDAVTAGAAAAERGIPVLLTGTEALAQPTADALAELGVTTTYVAGGTAVVSDAAANAAPNPQRVAGPNRFGTAAAVAGALWDGLAADDAFVLANLEVDFGWALALAASPVSVRINAPQLGVRAADLPAETQQYLTDAGVTDPGVIALGDVTVIDDQVVTQVAGG